jgi:hypothetical protein
MVDPFSREVHEVKPVDSAQGSAKAFFHPSCGREPAENLCLTARQLLNVLHIRDRYGTQFWPDEDLRDLYQNRLRKARR